MSAALEGGVPVAPSEPPGRPRVWQSALIAAACGVLAAWSCSGFLDSPIEGPESRSGEYALAFLASTALGAGPLMLVVFRLWPRRQGGTWPGTALLAWLVLAGILLAPVGCIGIVWSINTPRVPWEWRPLTLPLASSAFVTGLIFVFGAIELLVVGRARRIVERRPST